MCGVCVWCVHLMSGRDIQFALIHTLENLYVSNAVDRVELCAADDDDSLTLARVQSPDNEYLII